MRARIRMLVAKLFSLPMRSCGHKESIFSFLPHPLIRLCSRPFIRRLLPIDHSIHLSMCPSVLPVESSSIHTLMPTSTSSHRSRHTSLHPSSRIQETPGNRREVLEIGQFPLKAFFKDEAISDTKAPRATEGPDPLFRPCGRNRSVAIQVFIKNGPFRTQRLAGPQGAQIR